MYCHSQYEIFMSGGCHPEEALEAVKALMIGAADQAEYLMTHGHDDENGEDY
jgi:hypothetical protein